MQPIQIIEKLVQRALPWFEIDIPDEYLRSGAEWVLSTLLSNLDEETKAMILDATDGIGEAEAKRMENFAVNMLNKQFNFPWLSEDMEAELVIRPAVRAAFQTARNGYSILEDMVI